jgi:hypothetical protein
MIIDETRIVGVTMELFPNSRLAFRQLRSPALVRSSEQLASGAVFA